MPPSIKRGRALACTTVPSQARHAYSGRIVRRIRSTAGTRSTTSLTSSPMRCNAPAQHGHVVVSGSIVTSTRGRCLGKDPMLRLRFFRVSAAALFPSSSPRRHSPASGRRPRRDVAQPQRQLFGDEDDGALFRSRPEYDRPQLRDRRLQCLDFVVEGEHHLDQLIKIASRFSGRSAMERTLTAIPPELLAIVGDSGDFSWPFYSAPTNPCPIQAGNQKPEICVAVSATAPTRFCGSEAS